MFAIPKWEEKSDVVKFKHVKGRFHGDVEKAKKKKSKKNKRKSKNAMDIDFPQGKGPLAPKVEIETTPKIKTGRIEKSKNAQKTKQQQKLKPSKALKAAALEAINAKQVKGSLSAKTTTTKSTNSYQDKLKEQLMGGRFRYINEQLYTMNSQKAEALFREDADAFSAYHAGYRHQVEKWPMNPLDRIIKQIRKLPKALIVGDFGCGEGRLAKSITNKVYSMDLVSCRDDIIACDMANTPLEPQSIDIAVYCLSLMGTNLNEYLLELNRVLKVSGCVYIAEIQTRFSEVREFIKLWEAAGFKLIHQDVGAKVFYFFKFQKVRDVGKVAVLPTITLKPCLYRKR